MENLASTKVYLFGGKLDQEVPYEAVEFAKKVWNQYTAYTHSNYSIMAGHTMVTDFYGYRCTSVRNPWISNCYFDLAYVALDYLIGPLNTSYLFYN